MYAQPDLRQDREESKGQRPPKRILDPRSREEEPAQFEGREHGRVMSRLADERNSLGRVDLPALGGRNELRERSERREFLVPCCWRTTTARVRWSGKEGLDIRRHRDIHGLPRVEELCERRGGCPIRKNRAGSTAT
ncbi:MAG: hypothetical protein RDU25_00300 [Patescibacteria group bacterium]|nr:hypothetical protein [Patescibacteria group bacterium]